jgi:cell division protein FtsN
MQTVMNKQLGGTILGLMIGVVLGLAAALAVAVFVTKTPSPFNNKMQNHTVETDATESKKNKDWDPNAALSGKNPAKPTPPVVPGAVVATISPVTPGSAPAASTATASATTTTKPSVANNTAPAMPPEKPAKLAAEGAASPVSATPPVVAGSLSPSVAAPKPSTKLGADPISDLMKSKVEPKTPNSTLEPFIYFVQAGAFRTPEDAEAQRARLSLQGIDTKVTEREQAGRTVYRVRSGPFNKEEDADRIKDKLSATGSDAALVRVQR